MESFKPYRNKSNSEEISIKEAEPFLVVFDGCEEWVLESDQLGRFSEKVAKFNIFQYFSS